VLIASNNEDNARAAVAQVEGLTKDLEVGKTYRGTVKRIMPFGAFVEVLPGKEGLVRIGELSLQHIPTVEDAVKLGDTLDVKVIEIDSQGRVNLSHRQTLPGGDVPAAAAGDGGFNRGGERGGFNRGERGSDRGGFNRGERGSDRGGFERGGFNRGGDGGERQRFGGPPRPSQGQGHFGGPSQGGPRPASEGQPGGAGRAFQQGAPAAPPNGGSDDGRRQGGAGPTRPDADEGDGRPKRRW
jgi:polyribonucleotide nucleotidyltransferase